MGKSLHREALLKEVNDFINAEEMNKMVEFGWDIKASFAFILYSALNGDKKINPFSYQKDPNSAGICSILTRRLLEGMASKSITHRTTGKKCDGQVKRETGISIERNIAHSIVIRSPFYFLPEYDKIQSTFAPVFHISPSTYGFMRSHQHIFILIIRGIATLASDPEASKTLDKIFDTSLPHFEKCNWRVALGIARMRRGERDLDELIYDTDPNSSAVLETLLRGVEKVEEVFDFIRLQKK